VTTVQRRHQLGIVVIIAEIGMAVRIGPDPDLGFPEAVRSSVLTHLPDRDFSGTVGIGRIRLLLCGIDGGAVREQRMRGVTQVFQI